MTAAATPYPSRHVRLDARKWWRCLIDGVRPGTVTGYLELGSLVTVYEVLEEGRHAYQPSGTIEPAPPLAGRDWIFELVRIVPPEPPAE